MNARVQERFLEIPALRRLAPIKSFNSDQRTVDVMWSAGAQVRRYDWWEDEYWLEELDLTKVNLSRLNNGAPVLNSHARGGLDDVIGVVERAWVEKNEGMATLRFSSRADVAPFVQDVKEGILRSVSIGYEVLKYEEVGFDKKTGYRVMRAVDWVPFEVSFVPVGADADAGARARGAAEEVKTRCEVVMLQQPAVVRQKGTTMDKGASAAPTAEDLEREQQARAQAEEKLRKEEQLRKDVEEKLRNMQSNAIEMEAARRRAIENLSKANNIEDKVREYWIGAGLSLDAIAEDIMKITESRAKNNPDTPGRLGLSRKEAQRFSVMRAMRAVIENNWKEAGFELDCTRAVANRLNKIADPTKFYVPMEVQERDLDSETAMRMAILRAQMRDLTVATTTAGGFLVETANLGFIEMLRNRSVVMRMGARRLTGLQGNVTIPKQTAAATAFWLATEATAITESQQTFAQMALTPKTVGAYTEISRLLLLQSSPEAEGLVMSDLAQVTGLAVDLASLEGTGSAGQPTGISATAGIGAVTGTSLGYAGILEFQTDVATGNVEPAAGGYVTTPAVAALMMQRARFSSTDTPLWVGNIWNGSMSGFPAMSSNQPTAATMVFGDWSQLIIGEWGVLEIAVNPQANFPAGIIGIRAMYTVDIGVRYPVAFSRATTIT